MTEREVIYRLKVVADPNNAKEMDALTSATMKATAAFQEQATAAKAASEAVTGKGTALGSMSADPARDSLLKYQGVIRGTIQDQNNLAESASASYTKTFNSVEKLMNGTLGLARATVLLSAANSENAESALRVVARFEAGASAAKGAFDLIEGGSKAYELFNGGTTAVSAIRGTSGVTTAIGAAGTVAPAIGAAGAGGAATGLAGGAGALALALAPLIAIAAAVVGAFAVVASIVSTDFREGLLELIGWNNAAADSAKKVAEAQERIAVQLDANKALAVARLRGDQEQEAITTTTSRALPMNADQRLSAVSALLSRQYGVLRSSMQSEQTGVGQLGFGLDAEKQKTAIQAVQQLETERYRLTRQVMQETLQGERQQLAAARERLTALQAAEQAAKAVYTTTAERLANLSADDQTALSGALAALKSGKSLNVGQANILGVLGPAGRNIEGFDSARESAFARSAAGVPGLAPLLETLKRQADAAESASRAGAKLVEVKAELVHKLEVNFDADAIAKEVIPKIRELGELLKKLTREATATEIQKIERDRASQNAQIGRGP